jgi:hypothetical protein
VGYRIFVDWVDEGDAAIPAATPAPTPPVTPTNAPTV